jgi:hypothetical protein
MVLKETKKMAQRTGQRTYPELPLLWQLFEETPWVAKGRGFRVTNKPPNTG